MTPRWYIARGDQKVGPFSFDQLKQLVNSEMLKSNEILWNEGSSMSVPAGTIPGLGFGQSATGPSHMSADPSKSPLKVKQLLLGSVGGVLWILVVRVVAFVLFLFAVMLIVGLLSFFGVLPDVRRAGPPQHPHRWVPKPVAPKPTEPSVAASDLKFSVGSRRISLTNSGQDLKDVRVTLKMHRIDGTTFDLPQVWGMWAAGEAKRITIPVEKYQKHQVSGIAKRGIETVRIDVWWSWTEENNNALSE